MAKVTDRKDLHPVMSLSSQLDEAKKAHAQVDASLSMGLILWMAEKVIQGTQPLPKSLSCWISQP